MGSHSAKNASEKFSRLGTYKSSSIWSTFWFAGSASHLLAASSVLNLSSYMLDRQPSLSSFLCSELIFWYYGSVSHLLTASSVLILPSDMLDLSVISWQLPLFWSYLVICWICQLSHGSFLYSELTFWYAGSVSHLLAASSILNTPSDMLDLSAISWQLPLFWIYLLICWICQPSLGSFLYSELTFWYAGSVSHLLAASSILNLPSDMLDL
jgi:hypothetical protein